VVSLLEHAGGAAGDVFGAGDILPILLEALIGRKGSRGRGFEGSSGMLKNFKELKVWQKAYSLCLDIYRFSRAFPKEEKFGLTSQVRRAAVSIPSNIAEGYGRKSTADYVRMLYIAYGSLCELETQIMLAGDLSYLEDRTFSNLIEKLSEVERMLKALIQSLENKSTVP
jgi:four helix bundle protein